MVRGPKSWTEWVVLAVATSIAGAYICESLIRPRMNQVQIDFYGGLTHT